MMSDLKAAAERHEQAMRAAVIAAANGEPLPDGWSCFTLKQLHEAETYNAACLAAWKLGRKKRNTAALARKEE